MYTVVEGSCTRDLATFTVSIQPSTTTGQDITNYCMQRGQERRGVHTRENRSTHEREEEDTRERRGGHTREKRRTHEREEEDTRERRDHY
ncbi:hypothetical protein Pmani_007924 [Petrolisthes manimaculis]|uniref:Uncharacterized protein n=1 Tax=Petrolisthes manimaculis TaxID=1843537 RepID=A0AAE1UF75_9EUCA|nr:hypothetical protein Pmani_007924 [Petrolisthes manimaculis]